jgi:hypothetical protein
MTSKLTSFKRDLWDYFHEAKRIKKIIFSVFGPPPYVCPPFVNSPLALRPPFIRFAITHHKIASTFDTSRIENRKRQLVHASTLYYNTLPLVIFCIQHIKVTLVATVEELKIQILQIPNEDNNIT